METAKNEMLLTGGDNYFKRNMGNRHTIAVAKGCKLFAEFLKKSQFNTEGKRVLELGSCYGYNLKYLMDTNEFNSAYGIEPSKEAVDDHGVERIVKALSMERSY